MPREHTLGARCGEHAPGAHLGEHTLGSTSWEHALGARRGEHTLGSTSQEHTPGARPSPLCSPTALPRARDVSGRWGRRPKSFGIRILSLYWEVPQAAVGSSLLAVQSSGITFLCYLMSTVWKTFFFFF